MSARGGGQPRPGPGGRAKSGKPRPGTGGHGKRRLEGHERPEEIYVLQHPEAPLEAGVAADEVMA